MSLLASSSRNPEPTALAIAEIVFGVATVTLAVAVIALVRALQRRATVQGRVTRSARRIEVQYSVGNDTFDLRGSTNYPQAPLCGQTMAVRYAQNNPSNASVAHENFVGAIAGLVVAVVFALLGGGLLWFAYQAG